MASRSMFDLNPELRRRAAEWARLCKSEGVDVLITCTYRSNAEQAALYALGRTAPGKIVTWAKPGQSRHNITMPDGKTPAAEALDFVPLVGGKPVWDLKTPEHRALWLRCIELAEMQGMVSGARWPRKQDWPHLELPREK